ncbi:MAG TPA: hypothetical protein VGC76_02455 [Pyrinomonadaceae bacterium]
MKKILFVTSLILLLSSLVFSQKAKKNPNDIDEPTSKNSSEKALLQSGTNIEAQLQSAIDVKKSKVGDEVVLKTTKSIRQNGQTIVPKGANLIGRITEVQQKPKNGGASRIGMIFDRIEGKNLNAPISASIVSVVNTAASANVSDMIDSDVSSSSSTSGRTSGGTSSGGLLGGVTNTVGGVANSTTSTVNGVTNAAGQTVGGATQTLGRTVNGIQISKSVSGSAQGATTLSSQDKNLRFEKGATFQLQLNGSVEN